jgi:phosphocarrier protein
MGDGRIGTMSDATCRASLEIVNKLGLHARAAVLFVQAATRFDAKVRVTKDAQTVDGRSIMGVMMLAAELGSRIEVETSGPQAKAALDAITELVANRFNEGE